MKFSISHPTCILKLYKKRNNENYTLHRSKTVYYSFIEIPVPPIHSSHHNAISSLKFIVIMTVIFQPEKNSSCQFYLSQSKHFIHIASLIYNSPRAGILLTLSAIN